jgi:hypothetical protein
MRPGIALTNHEPENGDNLLPKSTGSETTSLVLFSVLTARNVLETRDELQYRAYVVYKADSEGVCSTS